MSGKGLVSGREPHGIVPFTFASIQSCRLPSRFPGSSQHVEFGLGGGGQTQSSSGNELGGGQLADLKRNLWHWRA